MIYNILNADKQTFSQKLKKYKVAIFVIVAFAVVVNVVLTLLRTDDIHNLVLWLNIVIDIACGWVVLYLVTAKFFPAKNLYNLYCLPQSSFRGEIVAISTQTTRVYKLDCLSVTVGQSDKRIFFLNADGKTSLTVGQKVTLRVANNIIMEILQ